MDRLSGLTVLCFAGTYSLALLLDVIQLALRRAPRWIMTLTLVSLGWLVHTAFLLKCSIWDHHLEIGSQFDFFLILSWVFAAISLYLIARVQRTVAVGVFVLPMVVGLCALAEWSSLRPQRTNWASWAPVWGAIHGWFLTLGAVLTCVACVAGLMFLAQSWRLKNKALRNRGLKLPSLEQSERLNRLAIILAFPLLTFGLLIGVALNFLGKPGTERLVLEWWDPKILSAGAMWLIFAALLHARFQPDMRGRRVVILTLVAFGFLMFTLVGVNLLLDTAHGWTLQEGGQV